MAQIEEEEYIPKHVNYISLPNDEKLKASYYAYKVSKDTQELASEQGRSIFAEAIFDDKMQVLSRLCSEVLSRTFGPVKLPPTLSDNALALRIYFDALSIDLPLEKIYCIEDVPFWKRVVLKQIENSALQFSKDINWKNKGITQKFVNILESKLAEFDPDQELVDLAQKIKGYVIEMHIQHLQSLQESTFEKYLKEHDSDSEDSEEENAEDEYDWNYLTTSSNEDEEYDELEIEDSYMKINAYQSETSLNLQPFDTINFEIDVINDEIKQCIKKNRILIQDMRNQRENDQRLRLEYKLAKNAAEEERIAAEAKLKAQLKENAKALKEKLKNSKKKPPPEVIPSLFEIKLPNNEERIYTGYESIEDTRNPEQGLKKRKYKYPAKDCHHFDLSFLQYFTNLESLTIEFQGPRSSNEYHTRHYNVSYQDMKNLANGIKSLPKLKIFRLRNSRLDSRKFFSLINVLKNSKTVEVVDFGNDFLDEECALPMYIYLQQVNCLKSLELEGNKFGSNFLKKLAYGLYQYKSGQLEYLGLARNNLPYIGFHILIKIMCQTNHVKDINLTAVRIEDSTVNCCITDLISSHSEIESVNLLAVPLEYQTTINLESALRDNHKILALNIRGCGFLPKNEYEIEVLLQRNNYLKENLNKGNTSLNGQEQVEIVKKKRDPIYERVLGKFNKYLECLENRSSEFVSKAHEEIITHQSESKEHNSVVNEEFSETSSVSNTFRSHSRKYDEPFIYKPNLFDEAEIFHYLKLPGPEDRREYIRKSFIQ